MVLILCSELISRRVSSSATVGGSFGESRTIVSTRGATDT
jgi:hypothetical protein